MYLSFFEKKIQGVVQTRPRGQEEMVRWCQRRTSRMVGIWRFIAELIRSTYVASLAGSAGCTVHGFYIEASGQVPFQLVHFCVYSRYCPRAIQTFFLRNRRDRSPTDYII